MSVYPILWAIEHAPVVDAEERAILAALVTKGDFDGCNCYRSFASLARVACVDRRTAMRKVKAMTDRGLLREQIDPKPESWYRLPADKRPVVREAMIPASFWSAAQLGEINEAREGRGRAPITPSTRPELREAPPKKSRKDKGAKSSERGDTETPRTGVTSSHSAGGLQDTGRGDSESPTLRGDLLMDHRLLRRARLLNLPLLPLSPQHRRRRRRHQNRSSKTAPTPPPMKPARSSTSSKRRPPLTAPRSAR